MTARPIRYQRQVSDRKGKIFYTSITSLSHISKLGGIVYRELGHDGVDVSEFGNDRQNTARGRTA